MKTLLISQLFERAVEIQVTDEEYAALMTFDETDIRGQMIENILTGKQLEDALANADFEWVGTECSDEDGNEVFDV